MTGRAALLSGFALWTWASVDAARALGHGPISGLAAAVALAAATASLLSALTFGGAALARCLPAAAWPLALGALGFEAGARLLGSPVLGAFAGALLFSLGQLPALFVLRRYGAVPPTGRPRRGRALAALLAAAALLLAAAYHESARFAESRRRESEAIARAQKGTAPPERREAGVDLDADDALAFEGPWRSFELTAEVELDAGDILEVRCRQPTPDSPDGVSLFLSADPRFPSGFRLGTALDFEPLGALAREPLAGRRALSLRVEGRSFSASLAPGPSFACRTRVLPDGAVVLLAHAGSASVGPVAIRPLSISESAPSPWADRMHGALRALAAVLLLAAATALAVRVPVVLALDPVLHALLFAAPVLVLAPVRGDAPPALAVAAPLFAGGFLLTLPAFLFAHRSSAWRHGLALAVAVAVLAPAYRLVRERTWPPDFGPVNALTVADWSGPRLERDLLHFTHPALRRWNTYLGRHTFPRVPVALEKTPGLPRAVFLGSSSTAGYWLKLPWPLHVRWRLREEGFDVECVTAGVPGSTAPRLFWYLRNALLHFDPDLVCLTLTFNDTFVQTQIDERAYLLRVTAPDYRRTFLERIRDRVLVTLGERHLRACLDAFARGRLEEARLPDDGPERFERALEDYAVLLAERGVPLVLVKEPLAGDGPRLFKEEFYAAIDRVAGRHGLEVVDPTPHLQRHGGRALFLDEVHPTEEGAARIAEVVAPVVRRVLERGR